MVYVLDDNMGLSGEEDIGEIYVAGSNLCSGYVGVSSSDKFMDNPYNLTKGKYGWEYLFQIHQILTYTYI